MAKTVSPGLLSIALGLLVLLMFMNCGAKRSTYILSPKIIKTSEPVKPDSIFDLKYDLTCVPGPQKTADYYTKDLTAGGFCGASKWVAQQADYKILDGIGGSLLDQ
jgi:hypothetical protein